MSFRKLVSVFALVALLGLSTVPVAGATTFTLPDNYNIFDVGNNLAGNAFYAAGRINGPGANPLLFNLTTSQQIPISVQQYNGLTAISATVGTIDYQAETAWVTINYGGGITRTGTVSLSGGAVNLNPSATTHSGSNAAANAAAGGFGFGQNGQGQAAAAQAGGSWTSLTSLASSIWDAVSGVFGTRAVGGIENASGGSNAVVFTNLTITVQHDCGISFCSLQSISSDGQWGGLAFDSQVGLLNIATNTRYLLPGDGEVRGVLGGANPVLFYQSATGPRAWTLGGADLSYADWYFAVNGTPLGFVPTGVGDARVFGGEIYQAVNGSMHVVRYINPNQDSSIGGAVPEPETWAMMAAGLASLVLLRKRQSQAQTA